MASFWNRSSSSKKNTDKGKNKMGAGSSQDRENINILEGMACYDFEEYRVSDVEFSPPKYFHRVPQGLHTLTLEVERRRRTNRKILIFKKFQ